MNIKYIVAASTLLLLFGCSSEIKETSEEKAETIQSEEIKEASDENIETIQSEEIKETSDDKVKTAQVIENDSEISDIDTDITVNQEISSDNTESKNVTNSQKETYLEILKGDETLYDYYTDTIIGASNDVETDSIPTYVVDNEEKVIYLPTFEENKEVFDESISTIKIGDIPSEFVTYIEEPISSGTLITIDLNYLKSEHPALSYSIIYEEVEYEIMIPEEDPSLGIILLENIKINWESISELDIMIMK